VALVLGAQAGIGDPPRKLDCDPEVGIAAISSYYGAAVAPSPEEAVAAILAAGVPDHGLPQMSDVPVGGEAEPRLEVIGVSDSTARVLLVDSGVANTEFAVARVGAGWAVQGVVTCDL
jgi:hypothetical protein